MLQVDPDIDLWSMQACLRAADGLDLDPVAGCAPGWDGLRRAGGGNADTALSAAKAARLSIDLLEN